MKRTLLALVIAIVAPFAEAAVWTTQGPRGGAIRSLAAAAGDHNVLYVTAADGVFRSDLRSGSWSDITGPIEGANEIAVSPADPDTVIVGASNGVFRSGDGGKSWQAPSGFVKGAKLTRVLIDPRDPSVVYVAATGYEGAGVYKSVDGGRTFFDSSGSLPWWERWIEELALDPVAPDHLHLRYTYTDVFGYATSRDAGKSWSVTEYRSPAVPTRQILASPRQGGRRYGVGGGFWISDDGETWSALAPKELQRSSSIYPSVLAIDPAVPRLFTGTPFGAYRSGDNGYDWLPLEGAGQGDAVNGIDFDPASGAVVIGTDAGLFRSTAPWNAWTDLQLRNLSTPIENVAADPSSGDVYAVSGPRLFRSRDLGQSWQQAGPRLPFVIVRPWSTVSVYIGADHSVYAGYQRTVWRLRDGEDGWDVVRNALPTQDPAFFAHPRVPRMLYSAELEGIARSFDGGTTWTTMKTPLVALSVYADAEDPDILLCVATDGSRTILIRSADGGVSWSTISTPASFFSLSFTGAPSAPNVIYMLLGKQYFARSGDHGVTWSAPSAALYNFIAGDSVVSVVVDPHDPDVVYAATASGRVFASKDGAGTWSEMPSRPPGSTSLSLTVDSNGLYLHAGTRMRGVWELSLTRRRAMER